MPEDFERLTPEVILIDGKYYRAMTDEECADFIWGISPENEASGEIQGDKE